MNISKKIIQYGLKNYSQFLIILITLFLIYLHHFIYLGGDDYIYGSYIKGDMSEFVNLHLYHYFFKNGRFIVHLVVTLFLLFDVYLWRIVNPIAIMFMLILIGHLASNSKEQFRKAICLIIMLFSFISINITREAVFWLDGSFNYLYPMILFLLNVYLIQRALDENKIKWYLIVVGFLSGATVEQAGLMTIGYTFLLLIDKLFINKKYLSPIIYANFIATIIGYLTVVLAPGNFIRTTTQTPEVFGTIIQLFRYNFMSDGMEIYLLLLMLSAILWLISFLKIGYNKKLNSILLVLMGIKFILYALVNCLIDTWEITSVLDSSNYLGVIIWAIVTLSGCFTIAVLVYQGIMIYIKQKDIMMIAFIIVAIGAQFMMIISSIYGYRTIFPSLMVWFIIIIMSIVKNWNYNYSLPLILLCMMLSLQNSYIFIISFISIIIFFLIRKRRRLINCILSILFIIIVIFNFQKTLFGFKENQPIHEYNLSAIRIFKENNFEGELILKKAKNYEYRYTMIYESEPHISSFKKYYELPENTIIKFLE